MGHEYDCDRCGITVPDGSGIYHDNDRLCYECAEKHISWGNTIESEVSE